MPLGRGCAILKSSAPGGRIAAEFARDRRRRPHELPCDEANTGSLSVKQRNLLPLGERQETFRLWCQADRGHSARATKPTAAYTGRYAARTSGTFCSGPSCNFVPEDSLFLPCGYRWSTKGRQRRAASTVRFSRLSLLHSNLSFPKCCDDRLNSPNRQLKASQKCHSNASRLPKYVSWTQVGRDRLRSESTMNHDAGLRSIRTTPH